MGDLDKCRICNKIFSPYTLGEKNGYKLVACKSCGSVMTDPLPTAQDLEKYFGEIQPQIVHLPNPAGEIAALKKRLMRATHGFSGKRFLDACCRNGYAVMAAKELLLKAKGIDSRDFFIRFAKEKYDPSLFEHTSAQSYAAGGGQADIVVSLAGFCENPDPDAYMAALAKIIAPGGMMYIEEPDGNHFLLPWKFERWRFCDPPVNFLYISKTGMEALLKRHGLKIKRSFFTWAPVMRFVAVKA